MNRHTFEQEITLAKMKAELAGKKVQYLVDSLCWEIQYRAVVSPKAERQMQQTARNIAGETLHYLKDQGPATLLGPIQPDQAQIRAVTTVLEAAEAGNLKPHSTGRVKDRNTPPIFSLHYDVTIEQESGTANSSPAGKMSLHTAEEINFDVTQILQGETSLRFYGTQGYKIIKDIELRVLPELADTPEKTGHALGEVQTYGNGKRIIQHRTDRIGRQTHDTVNQWYLLGSFEGEKSGTRFVYGNNRNRDSKSSIKQEAEARTEFALATIAQTFN